ncbi:MAG: polysaccharide deacetylase family protein [Desulfopila sp.]
MNFAPAPLYSRPINTLEAPLRQAVKKGAAAAGGEVRVFFRADDIGVPSKNFSTMLKLFQQYLVPLGLAVVPTWLTALRWHSLCAEIDTEKAELFCWHQHGWTHKNHETRGKKQEFGDSRPADSIAHDLLRGRNRLEQLLGAAFSPLFTPPWNRCGATALELLATSGYTALSRSSGAHPLPPTGFADIQINVDLHTRREADPQVSARQLFAELEIALASGHAGIMLHHQRMNRHAFDLLECLLHILTHTLEVRLIKMVDMVHSCRKDIYDC